MKKLIFIFLLLAVFNNCRLRYLQESDAPVAQAGILDLRTWNFQSQGPVKLKGDWTFYWEKLLTAGSPSVPPDGYFRAPGSWSGKKLIDGRQLKPSGFATFRLRLILPPNAPELSVYMREAAVAWKLYQGERVLFESGKVARDKSQSAFLYTLPRTGRLNKGKEVELFLQISNFTHSRGGPTKHIILGRSSEILEVLENNRRMDFFLIGAIAVVGIYNLFLFLLRPASLPPLWFGLYCILGSFWTFITHGYLQEYILEANVGEYILRIIYGIYYSQMSCLALFGYSLYPQVFGRFFARSIILLEGLLLASVFIFPPLIFTRFIWVAHLLSLSILLWSVTCLIRISLKGMDKKPLVMLFAFSSIFLALLNDILRDYGIINTNFILNHYGLFLFIMGHAVVIAISNAEARIKAEQMSLELQEKNSALNRLDKAKDEFLAVTSHELRTPLAGITGIADSMKDGATGALTPLQFKHMEMIRSSGKRLSVLLDDILDYSRLKYENIILKTRSIDVEELIDVVITLLTPMATAKKLRLVKSIPGDTKALADESRVQQILFNLVGNALKFTDSGEIRLETRTVENMLEISVRDTGPGITPDKQALIFEYYEQDRNQNHPPIEGAGLGLAVTRKLVEMQGGKIEVTSPPEGGSVFCFTLPRFASEQETVRTSKKKTSLKIDSALARPTQPRRIAKPRLLLAQNNPEELGELRRLLDLQQFQLTSTGSGSHALELLKSNQKFDLALLNVALPEINGLKVTEEIRKQYTHLELPILLTTNDESGSFATRSFEAGANDYITKPYSGPELLSRINSQLNIAGSAVQLTRLNQELRREADRKNEFLSRVSHELMTPLSAIYGYSELLQLSESQNLLEYVNEIHMQSERLSLGIREALLATELTTLKPGPRAQVSLASLLQESLSALEPFRREKSVEIIYDNPDDFLVGDSSGLLERCLECLLRSALCRCPQKGTLLLEVSEHRDSIKFTDYGLKIHGMDEAHIWDKFNRQSHQDGHNPDGLGLGLFLARRAAQLLGYRVELENNLNPGNTFALYLN